MLSDVVLDLKEFQKPISIKKFCRFINAKIIVESEKDKIYGYTVIDSLKAIIELPPLEMVKLYGLTTERVLIFTDVTRGRSPMVAIKVTNLRPALVLYHGKIEKIDDLAIRIAQIEGISLGIIKNKPIEDILKKLETIK